MIKEIKQCSICGKDLRKRKNESWKSYDKKDKHIECYRTAERPQRRTGISINCDMCGVKTYKSKVHFDKNKNNFCSLSCANKYQKRNKLKFTCKICGKGFYWSRSRITQANPTYCTMDCRNEDNDQLIKNSIKGNIAQFNKKGPNKLELAGRKILKGLGIEFEEQVMMFEKFCVDVYIESINTVIQRDGIYWHSKQKRKKLDISQDAYMNKCGVKVLRFTDNDVYNLTSKVYETIKRAVGEST